MILNAFGKQCPMPVMMTKKEIDNGCTDISITVDNETAVKNLSRLAEKNGYSATVDDINGGWLVVMTKSEDGAVTKPDLSKLASAESSTGSGYSVFIGKDHVGEGDPELGLNLMKMALYTLSESNNTPVSLLFMNSGVKLVAGEKDQVVDSVQNLIDKGCEVLVCGTCLDFYGVKDALNVGDISNMYEILERMHDAQKVITL